MVNVGGHGADMEYPGILFDGMEDAGKKLYWLTTHEVGHSWFPMIVGSNERRDAWMDEGFNTFIDVYASDAFNHGEYAPKRDPEYAEGGGNPVDEILPILADDAAPAILTPADQISKKSPATQSATSRRRSAWFCCASRYWVRIVSMTPFGPTSRPGPTSTPHLRIFFDLWIAEPERTCRGGGAVRPAAALGSIWPSLEPCW